MDMQKNSDENLSLSPLEVSVRLEDEDYLEAARWAGGEQAKKKLYLKTIGLNLGAVVAAIATAYWYFLLAPVITVGALLFVNARQKRSLSGLADADRLATYRFVPLELIIEDKHQTWRFRWSQLSHFAETDRCLLIFEGPIRCRILPKNSLTVEQLDLARSWLVTYVGTKAPEQVDHLGFNIKNTKVIALWVLVVMAIWALTKIYLEP